jgi:uncharacterized protein YkwD
LTVVLVSLVLAGAGPFQVALAQVEERRNTDSLQAARSTSSAKLAGEELSQVASQIVRRTNSFRQSEGADPVTVNETLARAAQKFADYMASTNRYGHTADGRRPAERAAEEGYEYCLLSENIAYQWSSQGFSVDELALKLTQGWEESPGHRANMLNEHVTETGVAVARSAEQGTYFAVQMFGRPASLAVTFEVENRTSAAIEYTVADEQFALPPQHVRSHQRCMPAELTFSLPAQPTDSAPLPLTPAGGERFIVEASQNGGLRVIAEPGRRD